MRKLLLLAIVAISVVACKKEKGNDNPNQPGADSLLANTLSNRIKDTSLLYARDIYLWHTQIPNNINPRTYADPDAIMRAIRPFSQEPGFSTPVDRWSFGVKQAEWDNVSGGIAQDFGMYVFFLVQGDLRVRFVEKNSPAWNAGIRRGWRITSINGNSNINTSNADFIVNAVYRSNSSSFTFQRPDGTNSNISLTAATYQSDPVLLDSIYTAGGKKIGYLVFNSFLGDTAQIFNNFNRIFTRFASNNVQDVIIDLRYNGGGFVSVMERMANYLVPASKNGTMMMRRQFNARYSNFNETSTFRKVGNLTASKIVFIVSNNSASASELLINNMRPHLGVAMVGPSPTFGKPVGYFPIPVGDWYIFPVSFRTVNSEGEGNYFNGFQPNRAVNDGIDKDWGDATEPCLASALTYLSTGSFGVVRPDISPFSMRDISDPGIREAVRKLNDPLFKGMISQPPNR